MKIVAPVVFTVALVAGPALAADYRILDISKKSLDLVEVSSVQREGQNARIWTVQIWPQATASKAAEMKVYTEFDCRMFRYRLLSYTSYDINGEVLAGEPSTSEWDYVAPDTVGSALIGIACKTKAPADNTPRNDLGLLRKTYRSWVASQGHE